MHPFKKHLCLRNQWTAYAADMNVLLSYYNLLDDWEDEKKPVPLILASALKKDVKRLKEKYPRQARAIETYLQKLKACEQEASTDPVSYTHLDVYKRQDRLLCINQLVVVKKENKNIENIKII